jgi:uncharacterized GH25 family protein
MKKSFQLFLFLYILLVFFSLPRCIGQSDDNNFNILEITPSQTILEYNEFNITITVNGTPIPNATVIIDRNDFSRLQNIITKTDINGMVTYKSPKIYSEAKSYFKIIAAKVGYITNEITAHIINLPNLQTDIYPYSIKENDIFTVTVMDDSLNLINNVEVSIWDENFTTLYATNYTDENGETNLRAPSEHGSYKLKYVKTGYLYNDRSLRISSSTLSINIDFNLIYYYLTLFGFFCIIPVVLFYIYMKNKK